MTYLNSGYASIYATKFKITVTGLKPSTTHKFYLADKDVSSDCIPLTGISTQQSEALINELKSKESHDSYELARIRSQYDLGKDLITDSSGKIEFNYFFIPENSPYENSPGGTYTQKTVYAKVPIKDQKVSLRSTDNSSRAESFIQVKNGSYGNRKIICTEMYRQTTDENWSKSMIIWQIFERKYLTKSHEKGYHFIFWNYATKIMPKSKTASMIGSHVAKHRTNDIYYILFGGKPDMLGRLYRKIFEPICYVVGLFVKEKPTMSIKVEK